MLTKMRISQRCQFFFSGIVGSDIRISFAAMCFTLVYIKAILRARKDIPLLPFPFPYRHKFMCPDLSDRILWWRKPIEGRRGHGSLTERKGERGRKPSRFFIAGGRSTCFRNRKSDPSPNKSSRIGNAAFTIQLWCNYSNLLRLEKQKIQA